MKVRFIAKAQGKRWGIYDTHRGSWPIRTPEVGIVGQDFPDEAAAQAEADRLNGEV